MKWFRIILAVYLLCLALVPCTDQVFNENNLTSNLTFNSSNQQPEAVHDTCSPLCLCNCCGINITLFKIKSKETPKDPVVFTQLIVLWKEQYIDLGYLDDIWQPPRLV